MHFLEEALVCKRYQNAELINRIGNFFNTTKDFKVIVDVKGVPHDPSEYHFSKGIHTS